MTYHPNNANGQAAEANSSPVALATEQEAHLSGIATNTATAATPYTTAIKLTTASNNATVLKSSPGTLGFVTVGSVRTSPAYLKFYNMTTTPAPATDTPVAVFLIPGTAASTGAGTNLGIPMEGLSFSTGIAYAIVTGIASNNNTSTGASDVIATFGYK